MVGRMRTDMRASLEALLDEYAGLASRLARMQADVAAVTGCAHSAEGGISATVNPNGELVRLSIDDPARWADSQVLAAQIVEVVRRAATDARDRVGAIVSKALPQFEGALRTDGTLDVTRLLPPVTGRDGE
jgi:DNA-binding protein YbaB